MLLCYVRVGVCGYMFFFVLQQCLMKVVCDGIVVIVCCIGWWICVSNVCRFVLLMVCVSGCGGFGWIFCFISILVQELIWNSLLGFCYVWVCLCQVCSWMVSDLGNVILWYVFYIGLLCWFVWQCRMMKLCICFIFWWLILLYSVISVGLMLLNGNNWIRCIMVLMVRWMLVDFSGLMKLFVSLSVIMFLCYVFSCCLLWNGISQGLCRGGFLMLCSSLVCVLLLDMWWLENIRLQLI